jgi:hypothetical protein
MAEPKAGPKQTVVTRKPTRCPVASKAALSQLFRPIIGLVSVNAAAHDHLPRRNSQPACLQANAVMRNTSASSGGIRSSGRTSMTIPVPSALRAKESGVSGGYLVTAFKAGDS